MRSSASDKSSIEAVNLRFENMNLKQEKDKWQLACTAYTLFSF